MPNDEQSIRDLIATWHAATAKGDLPTVLTLMAEDVVFLVPGRPPMRGRDAFAASFQGVQQFRIESKSEIQEIKVTGDWAYCWTHLTVNMTPIESAANKTPADSSSEQSGKPKFPPRRSGYTLSIFRKNDDGKWVLFRDANLLAAES